MINRLVRVYLKILTPKVREILLAPEETQQKTLQSILKKNKSTAYGTTHYFNEVLKGILPFTSLPLTTYDDITGYIDRIKSGEHNVLSADKVAWLATSSGTTGQQKLIPYSQKEIKGMHLYSSWLSLFFLNGKIEDFEVFASKNLLIGGTYYGETNGLGIADISAIIIRSIPTILQPFFFPDVELATHKDYAYKLQEIAKLASQRDDVQLIGGVPAWNISFIKLVLEYAGKEHIHDVWPKLTAFKHGGTSFPPYRKVFDGFFDNKVLYHEIYNGTEGFFAIQDSATEDGLLLILNNGIYYEFIEKPLTEDEAPKPAIPLADVELGKSYSVVITTTNGLCRYLLGDVVQFVSRIPYRIKVIGRQEEFINAFGEDLLRPEADLAISNTCNELNLLLKDYTACPIYSTTTARGTHEWLVELTPDSPAVDLTIFADLLDRQLQQHCYNYLGKRVEDVGMLPPQVRFVPPATFERWLFSKGNLGGQRKVPRLRNDRSVVEEVLALIVARKQISQ